jgi:transposase
MPKILRVRAMTDEERKTIEQLSRSRTASVRQVERARIVHWASEGQRVPDIAARLGVAENTVRNWLNRFNEAGLPGICDEVRSGRPPTYSADEVSVVVATALTKPDDLALPFGYWTLDRLEVYLNEQKGIAIKRSRINEILQAEGLRWRKDEHWFGERVDPDFAKKRGSSRPSTSSHLQGASS